MVGMKVVMKVMKVVMMVALTDLMKVDLMVLLMVS